jgi:DNA-binding response OmpR family regulator
MARILIVEDELDLSNLIRTELEADGHHIEQAFDGHIAVQYIERQTFDLVILDWMLPGLDGLAVCRRIRQHSLVPIVMLTARTELVDRVLGLEVGADDYISKPFSMHELRARIFALLRRVAFERQPTLSAPPSPQPSIPNKPLIKRGDLIIYPEERMVNLNGNPIELTRKEFDLLLLLATHVGRTFGREYLLDNIWGTDYEGLDRVVDTQITRLRKKLGPHGEKIATIWGIGYRYQD